jgi:hypothetical protein
MGAFQIYALLLPHPSPLRRRGYKVVNLKCTLLNCNLYGKNIKINMLSNKKKIMRTIFFDNLLKSLVSGEFSND